MDNGARFTDFMYDVERYLKSKFPEGIPEHVFQDVSAYVANRAIVLVDDFIYENNRVWERSLRKGKYEHTEKEKKK